MSKSTIILFGVIVVALAAALFWYKGKNDVIVVSNSPTVSTTPTQSSNPNQVKTYTSQKLGISFKYLAEQGDPIIEEDDTIYVSGKAGQYVKVFTKDPKLSLADAINQKILKGYSPTDCFLEKLPNPPGYPSTMTLIGIAYPHQDDPELAQQYFQKCPTAYAETNGIRYFFMDQNHPDKFLYFDIGQYAIMAEPGTVNSGAKTWQDTLTFTK